MPDQQNLELPPGIGELLQQISIVVVKGVAPGLGDLVPKILPTMMFSAAQTLLAASGALLPQCNLDPPPADTFISIDALTRNLRFECKHSPPHCWDLAGKKGSC